MIYDLFQNLYMQATTMIRVNAYEKYLNKLVKCLPMNDVLFTTELSTHKLLPANISHQIDALPTPADKASYLLGHVIKPALDIDDTTNFDSLLSIMEHCGYAHVETLACNIKSEIDNRNNIQPGIHISYCIVHMSVSLSVIDSFISVIYSDRICICNLCA